MTPLLNENCTQAIMAAHDLINADLSIHIRIPVLARKTGTNVCTLKKGFKSLYQVSIYQYLLRKRMCMARHLLLESRMKNTDIAYACGYESLAGFSTAYRRYYGMAPGRYRKQGGAPALTKPGEWD